MVAILGASSHVWLQNDTLGHIDFARTLTALLMQACCVSHHERIPSNSVEFKCACGLCLSRNTSLMEGLLCSGDGRLPAWRHCRVWRRGFTVRGPPGVLQPQPAGPLQLRRVPGQVQCAHAGAWWGRVHHAQCRPLLVL